MKCLSSKFIDFFQVSIHTYTNSMKNILSFFNLQSMLFELGPLKS